VKYGRLVVGALVGAAALGAIFVLAYALDAALNPGRAEPPFTPESPVAAALHWLMWPASVIVAGLVGKAWNVWAWLLVGTMTIVLDAIALFVAAGVALELDLAHGLFP
jgi:hypothetical protein